MSKMTAVLASVIVFCALCFVSDSSAQATPSDASKSGSVCVLPNPPEPPTKISPGGYYNPHTLTVQIDKREAMHWPHKEPVLIDDLDLQEQHLVVLTSDGKRIESFRFKFSKYHDARLCMYFDGYQGVQLGNRTVALWCKVEQRDCWR
jgi:hypothetical protein